MKTRTVQHAILIDFVSISLPTQGTIQPGWRMRRESHAAQQTWATQKSSKDSALKPRSAWHLRIYEALSAGFCGGDRIHSMMMKLEEHLQDKVRKFCWQAVHMRNLVFQETLFWFPPSPSFAWRGSDFQAVYFRDLLVHVDAWNKSSKWLGWCFGKVCEACTTAS